MIYSVLKLKDADGLEECEEYKEAVRINEEARETLAAK